MAETSEDRLYDERKAKAEQWRAAGVNPFGNGFRPSHTAAEVLAKHADARVDGAVAKLTAAKAAVEQAQADAKPALEAAAAAAKQALEQAVAEANQALESAPQRYSLAGRVVSVRGFGKAAFIVVQDRTGAVQVHVKQDVLGEKYAAFKLVDVADFVGVEGTVFRSKTGELTVAAASLLPLTKALRPLPGKFTKGADEDAKAWAEKQALADVEERYRRRYVDLLSNPSVKETFLKRTKLVQFIRRFLDGRGYVEVETPMMHPLVSGAAARPFVTHHNTLDLDLFLRIAPELYLKRLVVGGFDRVYEINRNFRNEGISTKHNPEFTMLEFYEAYATYEDLMDLTEELLAEAAVYVTGSTKMPYALGEKTHQLDFKKGWPRIPMLEAIRAKVPELSDKDLADTDKLRAMALKGTIEKEKPIIEAMNRGELIGALFEKHVEETLVQPTFITQFPVEVSPLARRNDRDPGVTDRFELFCVSREIANAFSELNDPVDQAGRFRAQLEAKARGQQETMDFDADYIRALEHGLPPTAGEGIGIDRVAMLFTNSPSIRDVILFPLLKPQK